MQNGLEGMRETARGQDMLMGPVKVVFPGRVWAEELRVEWVAGRGREESRTTLTLWAKLWVDDGVVY